MTSLVQHKVGETALNQATVDITVTSTGAGNIMVVSGLNTGTLSITGVADNATGGSSSYSLVSGSVFNGNANDKGEVWWAPLLKAGATTVTITFSAADTSIKDGFADEVSGLVNPAVDAVAILNNQVGAGTTDAGPTVNTSTSDGFALGVVTTSGGIATNPKAGNEFTAGGDIQVTTGNAACSLISTSAAAHQPVWLDGASGATYGAVTVAFKSGVRPPVGGFINPAPPLW